MDGKRIGEVKDVVIKVDRLILAPPYTIQQWTGWHDLGKTAFPCPGTDRCWACRLGKKNARTEKRLEKRQQTKRARQRGKKETAERMRGPGR